MFDFIQVLLIIVISVLTVLLTVIAIVIFQILQVTKDGLKKVNKMLDDAGRITESVANPIVEASDFIIGLKKGVSFFKNLADIFKEEGVKKDNKKLVIKSKKFPVRKFFNQKSKNLK